MSEYDYFTDSPVIIWRYKPGARFGEARMERTRWATAMSGRETWRRQDAVPADAIPDWAAKS